MENIRLSKSAQKLRDKIEKAIEDRKVSNQEYENIISQAMEDGQINTQEQALLSQLQEMIEDGNVKLVP